MDKQFIYQLEDGRVIRLIPEKIYPLGFMDLVNALNARSNSYNIRVVSSVKEIYESGELLDSDENVQEVLRIDFAHSLPIYALVEGGWLPPPFVYPKQFFFDRNVIGHIQAINRGILSASLEDTKFWLSMMESSEIFISPLLFAFESNLQRVPSLDEFKQGYEESVPIIKGLFPNATVPSYDDENYEHLYQFVEDVLARHDQEMEYLIRAVPMIKQHVQPACRRQVADELFEIAEQVGLSYISVPFLATISCLYENYAVTPYNTARRLLKLGGGDYTRKSAYNALSDMRGLVIYLAFRASAKEDKNYPYAYCTADKPALLFGCGLNAFADEFRDNRLHLSINLGGPLFEDIPKADRLEFVERIKSSRFT